MVENGRVLDKEFCDSAGIAPVLLNNVCHFLACLFPSGFAGCSRDKTKIKHLGCPLFIMVSFSRLLPEVVLPQMYHFMREGCEHLIRFPGGKAVSYTHLRAHETR